MRTPLRRVATLVASIFFAACSSGNVYVVRRPAPPPPPPPPRIEPLEITLARPIRGQLVVQTNRPSYVALFEIVPDRGVALLAPSYAHQRTWMLAGLNWVPVSWKVQSTMYYGRPSGTAVPARWVYAIASDEPLRLPDEAFHPSYMRRVLGPAAYRGTNPHVTMRAISRAFLPSVIDESWAEDAYALAATYASDPYRTVRIYCANRTVYEVPEEVADRAWCPVKAPSGVTIVRTVPARPDSIVANNGQRVRRRMPETTPVRAPIDRVSEPTRPEHAPVVIDQPGPRTDTPAPRDVKEKEKRGNGNAYGHTDDPNVKGRGIENEKANDPRRGPRTDVPANGQPQQPDKQAEKVEAKQERQEEKQVRQEQKQDEKQLRHEEKAEEKQLREEQRQDQKAEKAEQKAEKLEQKADKPAVTVEPPRQAEPPASKPEPAPVQKQDEPAPKPEAKQEAKAEAKAEAKEEKAEAKNEDKATGKPDEKPQAKPGIRPPGAKNQKTKP
jgi:hypothetical protein